MGDLAKRMLNATSKPRGREALLALEDGTCFRGTACGASGEALGEMCFNTSLEGYLEVVSDPSYAGQIVAMTYPQIGNYGVCLEDAQAEHPALRGLVVRDMCYAPSNWRSDVTLPDYLEREGVIAIEGVDTRALVAHIRDRGAMRAVLSTEDLNAESLVSKAKASEPIVGVNLASTVSCPRPHAFGPNDLAASKSFALTPPAPVRFRVVAYDCGIKRSILEGLARAGCELTLVPWDTPAAEVLAMAPDGVFLSNGPGDPDAVAGTYEQVKKLLGEVPLFGICLGHQMICKAAGGQMEKLKFGHHGGNQPVVNLLTGRVEITAQNHGFNLVFPSLGPLADQLEDELGNAPAAHLQNDHPDPSGTAEAESGAHSPAHQDSLPSHPDDLHAWVERGAAPVASDPSGTAEAESGAHSPAHQDSLPSHPDDLRVWVERGIAPVVSNPQYGGIQLTHVNLNDGTAEGIAFTDIPAFSVQYHPEANPGPADSHYLFTAFARLMEGCADYLDIDIAKDRLEGWRF